MDGAVHTVFEQKLGIYLIISLEMRLKDLLFDKLKVLSEVQVTISEERTVGGVVVLLVESNEVIVLQISDVLRLST